MIKHDVNNGVPNGTPKILILSNGVLNWDGVSKSSGKLEGDHGAHFKGWIETPIALSLVLKCSCVDDTIQGGFLM